MMWAMSSAAWSMSAGAFSFTHLPAGLYTLHVEGGYLEEGLRLTGVNGIEVNFSSLRRAWHAEQSNAGAMPGFSTVRVEVAGRAGLPVHIWEDDGVSVVRRTGDAEDLGPHVAEFRPLQAGLYMIEPEGLDVRTEVELTGLETVWVTFREQVEPVEPNRVRSLEQILSGQGEEQVLPEDLPHVESDDSSDDDWLETVERGDDRQGDLDSDEGGQTVAEPADVSAHVVEDYQVDEEVFASAGDRPAEVDTVKAAPSADAIVDAIDPDAIDPDAIEPDAIDQSGAEPDLSDAYIFLGDGDLCMAQVGALLNFVAENFAVEQRPLIGSSLDQASRAARVLLVGDVDEATMATLVQRSVVIEQLDDLV